MTGKVSVVMLMEIGGGRAGVHEYRWLQEGYNLDEVEPLRQQLLAIKDVGQVQKALRQVDIIVNRRVVAAVKQYNFDSRGIGFLYENYSAWRRLATGAGTIADAAYLVHEMAEVEELQRIQQATGFDFYGQNVERMSRKRQNRWDADFETNYRLSHSLALKAEYDFIAAEVNRYINHSKLQLTTFQAAAIDPTRLIRLGAKETEAAEHMLVDGILMKYHPHYPIWRKRANELIPLSKAMQRRLNYHVGRIDLHALIRLVKSKPIHERSD